MTETPRIDAHLHVWNRSRSDYAWIVPELGDLNADFDAATAQTLLEEHTIESAVLVQADDSADDTQFLLEVASAHTWVVGVVGWVPLEDPHRAGVMLEYWLEHPKFRGVRQLLHDDPRDVLGQSTVLDTLRMVASHGLTFDVPDAWPRLLPATIALADAIPELTVMIDHLGKPPNDSFGFRRWFDAMAQAARRPNVMAKLSGLHYLSADFRERAWAAALDAFGPSRIAYGGDWPMSIAHGGYAASWNATLNLIGGLSDHEQRAILSGSATRAYRLAGS